MAAYRAPLYWRAGAISNDTHATVYHPAGSPVDCLIPPGVMPVCAVPGLPGAAIFSGVAFNCVVIGGNINERARQYPQIRAKK